MYGAQSGIDGDRTIVKKVGLIVNPIAGMGGRVGLKGTDGADALREALELGAVPEAPAKTVRALEKLVPIKAELLVVTAAGDMGETAAQQLGFATEVVYRPPATDDLSGPVGNATTPAETSADDRSVPATTGDDTRAAAKAIVGHGVELLLFAGGDGTARDMYEAVGDAQVVLGIPAGVKIHSPVYANTPGQAGELALQFLTGDNIAVGEKEVVDIDEDAVRRDVLQTALYGYLRVPLSEMFMQNPKAPTAVSEEAAQQGIAEDVVESMEPDTCYIIGPGTTTRAIMQELGLPFTLLGVDVVMNGEVLGLDVTERDLLRYTDLYRCKLILTPVGGQGYLLGRGNQQISGEVVKRIGKANLIVVATTGKMAELRNRPLLVDTGDPEADAMLAGYHRVKTGYWFETAHTIKAG